MCNLSLVKFKYFDCQTILDYITLYTLVQRIKLWKFQRNNDIVWEYRHKLKRACAKNMKTEKSHKKFSKTMMLHYIKLGYRSALFLVALIFYIINRINRTGSLFGGMEHNHVILSIIWCVFAVEMLLRFFPSQLESMGCQKQFEKNYIPNYSNKEIGKHTVR